MIGFSGGALVTGFPETDKVATTCPVRLRAGSAIICLSWQPDSDLLPPAPRSVVAASGFATTFVVLAVMLYCDRDSAAILGHLSQFAGVPHR